MLLDLFFDSFLPKKKWKLKNGPRLPSLPYCSNRNIDFLKCGILRINEESHTASVIAFCLQMLAMTSALVEINVDIIESGEIISVKCSCKGSSNRRSEHAFATLPFCVE